MADARAVFLLNTENTLLDRFEGFSRALLPRSLPGVPGGGRADLDLRRHLALARGAGGGKFFDALDSAQSEVEVKLWFRFTR